MRLTSGRGSSTSSYPCPAAIDAERLQTRYKRGLLHMTLPKQGAA